MAKRSGGVRVGSKPHMSSSSLAFERRGNPWVTDKEGCRDFNRNKEVENPDMDADRQRHEARLHREKLFSRGDYKTTMSATIENPEFDSYFAEKAFKPVYSKVKGDHRGTKDWGGARKGIDFEVEDLSARRRRLASLSLKFSADARPHTSKAGKPSPLHIPCPRACGFNAIDSRLVARHIRLHANGCCKHKTGCNCPDCRRARNDS